MKYTQDNTIALDYERIDAIKEYVSYQEKFKALNAKGILTSFRIWKVFEEELPFDEQPQEIQDRIKALDDNPVEAWRLEKVMHKVEYWDRWFLVAPYYIEDHDSRRVACMDSLTTEEIKVINAITKIKIETYKWFLD